MAPISRGFMGRAFTMRALRSSRPRVGGRLCPFALARKITQLLEVVSVGEQLYHDHLLERKIDRVDLAAFTQARRFDEALLVFVTFEEALRELSEALDKRACTIPVAVGDHTVAERDKELVEDVRVEGDVDIALRDQGERTQIVSEGLRYRIVAVTGQHGKAGHDAREHGVRQRLPPPVDSERGGALDNDLIVRVEITELLEEAREINARTPPEEAERANVQGDEKLLRKRIRRTPKCSGEDCTRKRHRDNQLLRARFAQLDPVDSVVPAVERALTNRMRLTEEAELHRPLRGERFLLTLRRFARKFALGGFACGALAAFDLLA